MSGYVLGPLTAECQTVIDARRDCGHSLDAPSSLIEMRRGFPRPRHRGRPVPYTVRLDWLGFPEWSQNDGLRRMACVVNRWCGLCGLPLTGDALVAAGIGAVDPGYFVADRVAVHPGRCWRLTMAHCPGLRAVADRGGLVYWIVPVEDLRVGGPDDGPAFLQPDRPWTLCPPAGSQDRETPE